MRLFTYSLMVCLLLGGCGTMPPAPGIEPGGVGRYSAIVVVPLLTDAVRVDWSDGRKPQEQASCMTGWETREKAVRIVAELCAGSGTSVRGITDFTGLLPETPDQSDWASTVVQKLREAKLVRDDEIVLLLRQNAIDEYGRQYSSFRDFMLSGALGVAVGAATREDIYQPGFFLAVNTGFEKTMEGPSCCTIGFDAAIVNAAGIECIAAANSVLGREKIPDSLLRDLGWEELSKEEQTTAEMYCISALRRAIADTMNRLHLMEPRE